MFGESSVAVATLYLLASELEFMITRMAEQTSTLMMRADQRDWDTSNSSHLIFLSTKQMMFSVKPAPQLPANLSRLSVCSKEFGE